MKPLDSNLGTPALPGKILINHIFTMSSYFRQRFGLFITIEIWKTFNVNKSLGASYPKMQRVTSTNTSKKCKSHFQMFVGSNEVLDKRVWSTK